MNDEAAALDRPPLDSSLLRTLADYDIIEPNLVVLSDQALALCALERRLLHDDRSVKEAERCVLVPPRWRR
jgi:hypothetical protein